MADKSISFDKSFQIRVLDPESYDEAKKLKDNCMDFMSSRLPTYETNPIETETFGSIVNSFLEMVNNRAQTIETEKLKAIGLRNQVETEKTMRSIKQKELQALIAEKQAELDRYFKQYESLVRVEQEQKILLEKLANNEL